MCDLRGKMENLCFFLQMALKVRVFKVIGLFLPLQEDEVDDFTPRQSSLRDYLGHFCSKVIAHAILAPPFEFESDDF